MPPIIPIIAIILGYAMVLMAAINFHDYFFMNNPPQQYIDAWCPDCKRVRVANQWLTVGVQASACPPETPVCRCGTCNQIADALAARQPGAIINLHKPRHDTTITQSTLP